MKNEFDGKWKFFGQFLVVRSKKNKDNFFSQKRSNFQEKNKLIKEKILPETRIWKKQEERNQI